MYASEVADLIAELIKCNTAFRVTKLKNYGYYSFSNLRDISYPSKLMNAFCEDKRFTFTEINAYKTYMIEFEEFKFKLKYQSTKTVSKLVLDIEYE